MIKQTVLSAILVLGFMSQALAQVAQDIKATIVQIETTEKEAMVMVDGSDQVLLIRNLTKFTAGELSLLRSSLEQSIPVKLKTQGNEIIAISANK